jgi:hypothetical protein
MKNEEIILKTTRKTLLVRSIFSGVIYTVIFYLLFSYDALLPLIELIDKVGLMTITMIMCPVFILLSVTMGYGTMIINGDFVETKEKPVKKQLKKKTKKTK